MARRAEIAIALENSGPRSRGLKRKLVCLRERCRSARETRLGGSRNRRRRRKAERGDGGLPFLRVTVVVFLARKTTVAGELAKHKALMADGPSSW